MVPLTGDSRGRRIIGRADRWGAAPARSAGSFLPYTHDAANSAVIHVGHDPYARVESRAPALDQLPALPGRDVTAVAGAEWDVPRRDFYCLLYDLES